MHIAFVRHGLTDWNLARRMQGRTDIPLNEEGRAQARAVAETLADELAAPGAVGWDSIVSSPLQRARETAELIGTRLALPPVTEEPLFTERSFGIAEGLAVADAQQRWPEFDGEDMEPDAEVALRGRQGLTALAERLPGSRVLVVSHGAFIRHLLAEIAGVPRATIPRIENVAVSRVGLDPDRAEWRVHDVAGVPLADLLPPR